MGVPHKHIFFHPTVSSLFSPWQRYPNTTYHTDKSTSTQMDVHVESFSCSTFVLELCAEDTLSTFRTRVASAAGLPEDGFHMSSGGEPMGEGYDVTQLSAGDTIVLAKTRRYDAVAALHAMGETDITAARLRRMDNPTVMTLLLQAGVTTTIPDYLSYHVRLTRLDLSTGSDLTSIGHEFLKESSLTEIDLSGLYNVTKIGFGFLSRTKVTRLDLSSLSGVTQLGRGFLSGCAELMEVDISPLQSVAQISCGCLKGCTALAKVVFSGQGRVEKVGHDFLAGCKRLTEVDLSALSDTKQIGSSFLSECRSLAKVDLTPLRYVKEVADYFLSDCTALTHIDLSPLSSVDKLGAHFLLQCKGLTVICLDGCSREMVRKAKISHPGVLPWDYH